MAKVLGEKTDPRTAARDLACRSVTRGALVPAESETNVAWTSARKVAHPLSRQPSRADPMENELTPVNQRGSEYARSWRSETYGQDGSQRSVLTTCLNCSNAGSLEAPELNPQDHIVFVVDDDRRICEALSELLSTFDLTRGDVRFRCRVPRISEARRAGLPDSGRGTSGHQRTRPAKPDRAGASPADRVHHGTWRHSHVRARDQGGRGRLPDQAVQGGGPDAGDPCRHRAGSRSPGWREPNWPSCISAFRA